MVEATSTWLDRFLCLLFFGYIENTEYLKTEYLQRKWDVFGTTSVGEGRGKARFIEGLPRSARV